MKKNLNISSIIFLTILSLVVVCSCNNYKSSCSVSNNSDYEVELKTYYSHSEKKPNLLKVSDDYNEQYITVIVHGPQISPYRDGSLSFGVSLDVFDKKSGTKKRTEYARIEVKDRRDCSNSSGREELVINSLEAGEYIVSINKAICEY